MPSSPSIRIAALQAGLTHSADGNPGLEANFNCVAQQARRAASEAPDLIVFPEYAISGWPYPSEETINGIAEAIPGDGPWYIRYRSLATELGVPLLCWIVERHEDRLYNAAFILDGKGRHIGTYRKVQANLGEQTWWGWSQGEAFDLIELDGVKYGISICADMWFPETTRCEELLGAHVILHISIADDMGHITPTRAFDSTLPIVASIFRGGSYAVDRAGRLLGKLDPSDPGYILFEIEPFAVDIGRKYGGQWIPKLGNQNLRNLGAYRILIDPATRPPWTRIFLDNEGNPQTRQQLLDRFNGRYDAHDPETDAS